MGNKKFERRAADQKKKINDRWRSPKGTDSKIRKEIKGVGKKPKPGYRTPKDKRGLHPSGYEEVLVHNLKELGAVEENEAVRIASKVGLRKKKRIIEKAIERDLKVLNPSEPEKWLKKLGTESKKEKEEGEKKEGEEEETEEKEEKEVFECSECDKTFNSKRGLKIHKGRVHK